MARRLVEAYNGRFIGILQPVSYFSETKLEHIRAARHGAEAVPAVYPLHQAEDGRDARAYDFTDLLNKREYIYIDFCHLSPNGNSYVVQELVRTLVK